MNIFYLDSDPRTCAVYHCDRHVVKMCLETAQLLSTACQAMGLHDSGLYRPTHPNHPCSLWVRERRENFAWTLRLMKCLLAEYTHRYNKVHKSVYAYASVLQLAREMFWLLPEGSTPPAQAMPESLRGHDPVDAYRRYYLSEKRHLLVWTRRDVPAWAQT